MATPRTKTNGPRPAASERTGALVKPRTPSKTPSSGAIAQRAYDLFLKRGCEHGHDIEDWLQAEQELRARATR